MIAFQLDYLLQLFYRLYVCHIFFIVIWVGYHELQYIIDYGDTNRYDINNSENIAAIFEKYKDVFNTVAFAIGDKYLISHAGVTLDRHKVHFVEELKKNPASMLKEIADNINKLYNSGYQGKRRFTFSDNCLCPNDYYGRSRPRSPL